MNHRDHDAHRAFEASTLHAGCTGACEWGEPCACSHSALQPSRRPRQPRRPEPRTPHLPLWTRFTLWRDRPRLTSQQAIEALKRLPASEWAKMVAFVVTVLAAGVSFRLAFEWLAL